MLDFLQSADEWLILLVQSWRSEAATEIMLLLSAVGEGGLIWLAICGALLLTPQYRRAGAAGIIAMAVGYLINDMAIKNLVARARPFQQLEDLVALGRLPGSFSFPSGHACSSFAAASAVCGSIGRRGAVMLLLAAAVAVSRVYLGVHFPIDVAVGSLVGALVGAATAKAMKKAAPKLK